MKKPSSQQKVLCNWGLTLQQSSVVHIQALVSADGILMGSSSKHQLLIINLASVTGGQLVNSPTAQSLPLSGLGIPTFLGENSLLKKHYEINFYFHFIPGNWMQLHGTKQ